MTAPSRPAGARRRRLALRLAPLCAWLLLAAPVHGARQQPAAGDGIARLLQRLEAAILAGKPAAYLELVDPQSNLAAARSFAQANVLPGATRVVVRERDRAPMAAGPEGGAYRLAIDVFAESGRRGRLATWRLDVVRRGTAPDGTAAWAITSQRTLSAFGSLYRLSLAERQYAARDLVIKAEDFELRLPQGAVFTADTDEGPTVLILIGRGQMRFTPTPATEREQMRIFCDADSIDTPFTTAFVRLAPGVVYQHITAGTLEERPTDPDAARRAQEVFRENNSKSFEVKLGDLTPDNWSLVPGSNDFLAEVQTRRFKTITYARSDRDPEDINLFDRAQRRNICLYTSQRKLADRGRFYSDDDQEDYEVLHYDIDTSIDPLRQAIEGTARLKVRTRADQVTSLTLRLAESLEVQSAVSREHGRLIALRVRNQNTCILNLPDPVKKDAILNLTITYSGRIAPQFIDREAIALDDLAAQEQSEGDPPALVEPSYLYSNRSYWYPQSETNAFATATLRVRVPPTYTCAGSGDPVVAAVPVEGGTKGAAARFEFRVLQPVRYLSVLITRLLPVRSVDAGVKLPREAAPSELSGVYYRNIQFQSWATPRMRSRANAISDRALDVLRFYSSLMGDCPYPTITLAVVERELPGGHSPGFLAVLAEPIMSTPYNWRADPTNFADFPEFFLAHELAHQWWGQAVGWKNYHEQWLSEGLAQYFAALYAERLRGRSVFDGVMGRMQEWALRRSSEGPVYLGYRIGHVKRDPQLFRAVVYNKSAAVLHMLRRLLGDDVFFNGLRQFYGQWRFQKAGSDDLRRAFEAASGRSLARFFDRWIYDSRVPRLKFSWFAAAPTGGGRGEAVLRFEQVGEVFDVPVTATLVYADRNPVDVVVKVTDAVTELRVPLEGRLLRVEVNRDQAAVARIEK